MGTYPYEVGSPPRRRRVDPITGLESLTDEPVEEGTGGLSPSFLDRYLKPIVDSPTASMIRTAVGAPRSYEEAKQVAGDVGISALKGAIAVPEIGVGLADLVSGGRAGRGLESLGFEPGRAKQILSAYQSPAQQEAGRAVQEAQGVVGTGRAILENPSVVPHAIVESIPPMLAGGAIGRGLHAAGLLGEVGAAALGEGLVTAGSAAEQTRQETPDGLLTPRQSALLAASGAITGGLGVLGGKVAGSKLGQRLGIVDPDVLLAGAARDPAAAASLTRRVLSSAFSEGILEEFPQSVQEQVLQNAAQGRPLDEGVDQAAVMGAITGAAMGGGVALGGGGAQGPKEYPVDQVATTLLGQAKDRMRLAPPEPRASPAPFPIENVGYEEWLRNKEDAYRRDQELQQRTTETPTDVRYLTTRQTPFAPGELVDVTTGAQEPPVAPQDRTGALSEVPTAPEAAPPAPRLYDVTQDPEGLIAKGLKGPALEAAARERGYAALQAGEGVAPIKPTAKSVKAEVERATGEEAQAEADATGVARETAAGEIIYPKPKLTIARDASLTGDIATRQEHTIAHLEADPEARLAEYWDHMKAIGKPENMVAIDDARDVVDPGYREGTDEERAVMTPGNLAAARALGQAAWEQKLSVPPKLGPNGERPVVIVQAGGPGSGKSTALGSKDFTKADIIVEATHTQWPAVKKRIDEAIAAGRDVELHYVYAPVETAMPRVLNRAMKEGGRTAEVGGVINAHHAGPETLIRAAEHYPTDRVKVFVDDNDVPRGELAIKRDVDFLRQVVDNRGRYGKEVDYRYAIEATHEAYQRGLRGEPDGISEAVYRGTLHGTGVEPRLEAAGPAGAVGAGREGHPDLGAVAEVAGRHAQEPVAGERGEGLAPTEPPKREPQKAARPAPAPTIERVTGEERPRKLLIQTRPDLAPVDYALRARRTTLPLKNTHHTIANPELDVSEETLTEIANNRPVGKLTDEIGRVFNRIQRIVGNTGTRFLGLNPSGDHYGVWYRPAREQGAIRTNPFALMGQALADVPAPQRPDQISRALAQSIVDVLIHENRHETHTHDTPEENAEFDKLVDQDAARLLPIRDRLEAQLRRVLEENHGEVAHAVERIYHTLHPEWASLQAGRAGWAERFPAAEAALPHGAPAGRAPGGAPEPRAREGIPARGGPMGTELAGDIRRGHRAPAPAVGPTTADRGRGPGPGGREAGRGEAAGPRRSTRRAVEYEERNDPRAEVANKLTKSYGVSVDPVEAGQLLQATDAESIALLEQHLGGREEVERYRQQLRDYFDRPEKKKADPFFSALRRGVEKFKQPAAPGVQWLKFLQGNQTVKAAEMKWTGLDDFLKSKAATKLTKAEILDYLDKNDVKIEEVLLGDIAGGASQSVYLDKVDEEFTDEERPEDAPEGWEPDPQQGEYRYSYRDDRHPDYTFEVSGNPDQGWWLREQDGTVIGEDSFASPDRARTAATKWLEDLLQEQQRQGGIAGPTRFSQYTRYANQPAGKNYRELLFKFPKSPAKAASDYGYIDPDEVAHQEYGEDLQRLRARAQDASIRKVAWQDRYYHDDAAEFTKKLEANPELANEELAPYGLRIELNPDVGDNMSYRRWRLWDGDLMVSTEANPFAAMARAWNTMQAKANSEATRLQKRMVDETRARIPPAHRPRSVPEKGFTGHYSEYENTFAHVRFEERTLDDGTSVLFIQEIQDDVNNKIRELQGEAAKMQKKIDSGAMTHNTVTNFKETIRENTERAKELAEQFAYRGTSHDLVMKRMIRWAAENGFDKVAWTTGEQQARRWSLTQTARKITYEPRSDTTTALWIEGKNGEALQEQLLSKVKGSEWDEKNQAIIVPDSMMAELLGRELSMKMVDRQGDPVLPEVKKKGVKQREDGVLVMDPNGNYLDDDDDWVADSDAARVFDTERQAERWLQDNITTTEEDDDGEEYTRHWSDQDYSTEDYEAPRIPFEVPRFGFTVRDLRNNELVDEGANIASEEDTEPIVFQTRQEAEDFVDSIRTDRTVDARSREFNLEGGNFAIEGRAAPDPNQLGFAGADFESMGEPPPPPEPPAPPVTKRSFEGLNLDLGGRGKKKFYDEIVKQDADKYIKKWGTRVGKLDVGFELENRDTKREEPHPVHSVDITPEMKRTVLYEGAPKFMKRAAARELSPEQLAARKAELAIQERAAEAQRTTIKKPPPWQGGPMRPGAAPRQGAPDFAGAYARGGGDVEAKPGALHPHPDIGLNIQKYDLPTEVQERLSAAVESLDAAGALPRDTPMTTAEVNRRAADILHWVPAEKIRKMFKEADRNSVAMVTAMRRVLLEQEERVEESTLAALTKGRTVGVPVKELDRLHDDYIKATSDQSANIAAFSGKVTEASRILAFQKQVLKAGRTGPEQLRDEFFQALRDQGVVKSQIPGLYDLYRKSLSGMTADQDAYVKGLRKAFDPGLLAKITELWKAMLLSGPATPVANTIGNSLNFAVEIGKTGVAGVLDSHRFLTGAPRERYVGEMGAQLGGIKNALPTAIRQLISDFGKIGTFKEVSPDVVGGGKVEHQIGAISGAKGRVIRTPFRILDVTDNFFKTLISSGESAKLAHRDGRKKGYEGHVLQQHMIDVIEKIREGRDEAMAEQVKQAVLRGTFQQKEGKLGSGLQSIKRELPWLEFILPFVRTPGNIAKTTWQMTPGGLLTIGRDLARGDVSKADMMDKLALTMMGSAFGALMVSAAKAGFLTGNGPTDKRERALKLSTGWQPNSIRYRLADGKDGYWSFSRFEPVGAIMGMAADIAESKDERNAKSTFMKLTGSLASNMTSKTYLQGLSDFFAFYNDPINQGQRYVQQLAGTVVPNIAARTAAAVDPTLRDESDPNFFKGIGKHIAARIPGVSQRLEPKYTATGREKERGGTWITRLFSPSSFSTAKDGMELEKELIRIGYVPSEIKREVRLPGGTLVRLTDAEFTQLQVANFRAAREAGRLMRSGYYRRLPDTAEEGGTDSKEHLMRQLFNRQRANARRVMATRGDFRRRSRQALAETREAGRQRQARETL